MIDKHTICNTIREIYPEIGKCGIDLAVDYDENNKAWAVELKRGARVLKTYLEPTDADACISRKHCIGLGVEIAQLEGNIERLTE